MAQSDPINRNAALSLTHTNGKLDGAYSPALHCAGQAAGVI